MIPSSTSLSSLSPQRPDPSHMRAQLFKNSDADGSGAITRRELTDALAAMPKPPGGGQAPDISQMFEKMDTDGDGEVGETEHTSFLETMDAARGAPPAGNFEGSADTLASLISALQRENEKQSATDIGALLTRFVESHKEPGSTYHADGSSASSGTRSFFEADV